MAELVIEGSHSAADGKERLEILARVPAPHACMLARDKGRAASSGLAVRGGEWAGFFLMRTNSQVRRRGYARRVLAALAGWARAHGARRAYLQVEEANQPARALYERTGFRNAYAYRFLRAR
jgi:GNAT superfamily N-acetyltransferase